MHDNSLSAAEKNRLWIDLYRRIMSQQDDSKPSFAVTFKGDDIWIVNNGAREENLSITFVALAWLWQYGPPRDNGCKPNESPTFAHALAVYTYGGTSSDGVLRTSGSVAGIRKTVQLLPTSRVFSGAHLHVCNYELEYSIALSYDDREGRPQRRYYQVDWASRRSPERRWCRKISKEEYDRAAAAYDVAVRSGSQWSFNIDPKSLDTLASLISTERATMERGDGHSTGAEAEWLRKVVFPNGRPDARSCADT